MNDSPLPLTRLPYHVGIIMDGNGRWAVRRGLPRAAGHRAGATAVRRITEASARLGIRQLSVIEIGIACPVFFFIQVRGKVLRNKPVKQKSQYIRFEIPSIHCSPQVICNLPYSTVKLIPLLFFGHNLIVI